MMSGNETPPKSPSSPKMPRSKMVRLSVLIPEELNAYLLSESQALNISVSAILRIILSNQKNKPL